MNAISGALQMLIDAKIVEAQTCTRYDCQDTADDHAAGTRVYMGNVGNVSYGDDVHMYVLAHGPFGGSDYSGSDIEESNHRSLLRDYPQFLIDMYGGYCSYGLALPVTFGQSDEDGHAMALAEELIGLAEQYPLYDEDDNSKLIDERATESWDQYVRADLERELEQRFSVDDVDLSEHEDDFWTLCSEHEVYPEAEGHRDVILRGIDEEDFQLALVEIAFAAGHVTVDYDTA